MVLREAQKSFTDVPSKESEDEASECAHKSCYKVEYLIRRVDIHSGLRHDKRP